MILLSIGIVNMVSVVQGGGLGGEGGGLVVVGMKVVVVLAEEGVEHIHQVEESAPP